MQRSAKKLSGVLGKFHNVIVVGITHCTHLLKCIKMYICSWRILLLINYISMKLFCFQRPVDLVTSKVVLPFKRGKSL